MKIYILKNCTCTNRKKKNGGKPLELTALRFATKNQRSKSFKFKSKKKSIELFTFFNQIPILIVFYLLFEFSEFTGAIVQDLSIGRSPIIFINRFRIHCSNPHANWFGSFSFNYIDDRI